MRAPNRAIEIEDIHRFWGLPGEQSRVAVAAECMASLICSQYSFGSWAFFERITALRAPIVTELSDYRLESAVRNMWFSG